MSAADYQRLMSIERRVEALEQLVAQDPVTDRIQRLEMRCGSLQSQLNLLRNKTPVEPRDAPEEDKVDATA